MPREQPTLAQAMYPTLPRNDNAKPRLTLPEQRRAAERDALLKREALLRHLREVSAK